MPQQRAELVRLGQYKRIAKKKQRLVILIIPKREKKIRQKTYKAGDHRGGHPSVRTPEQNTY